MARKALSKKCLPVVYLSEPFRPIGRWDMTILLCSPYTQNAVLQWRWPCSEGCTSRSIHMVLLLGYIGLLLKVGTCKCSTGLVRAVAGCIGDRCTAPETFCHWALCVITYPHVPWMTQGIRSMGYQLCVDIWGYMYGGQGQIFWHALRCFPTLFLLPLTETGSTWAVAVTPNRSGVVGRCWLRHSLYLLGST